MPASASRFDALAAFERELVSFGLVLPRGGLVADGKIHRIDDGQHHRKNNGAGWYILHETPTGLLAGRAGSWWRDRGSFKWNSRGETKLRPADRKAIAELNRRIEAERAENHRQGAERAATVWAVGKPCSSHPYLDYKRVQSYGLRIDSDGRLLIPLHDLDGELRGVQRITPDGVKRFTFGTDREKPTHFVIGQIDGAEIIAVVEGYATGATVHEATGWPVVVAFDAGGLEKIAKPLRAKLPKATLVFAGDHDREEKGGTGQKKAKRAARAAGGVAVMPPTEGHDWNDHAVEFGGEDVANRLLKAARVMVAPETVTLKEGERLLRDQLAGFFDQAARWNRNKADSDQAVEAVVSAAREKAESQIVRTEITEKTKDNSDLLAEVKRLQAFIDWHIEQARERTEAARSLPPRPAQLASITMGGGKTSMTRGYLADLVHQGDAVSIFLPLHRLTEEQAGDLKKDHGIDAAIWRGMSRPDPERDDGKAMCLEPELPKEASVAGLSETAVCKVCPSRGECGYQRQHRAKNRTWYAPHNLLFYRRPKAIPAPGVVVIDEKFHDAGMVKDANLAASTLQIDLSAIEDEIDREITSTFFAKLFPAFQAASARPKNTAGRVRVTRADLDAEGITVEMAATAHSSIWDLKPKPKLTGDAANMVRELKALAGPFTRKLPLLCRLVEELLRGEHDVATSIEVEPDATLKGGDGFGLMIWMHHRLEIHPSWHAPTLRLDGTAKSEIDRLWLPDLVVLPEIHVEAPHQRVEWVRSSFAKARYVPRGPEKSKNPESVIRYNKARAANIEEMGRYIEVQGARYRTGRNDQPIDVLVVTNQAIEVELKKGRLPSNVAIEHFNDLRGSNDYENVRAVIVVGRTLPEDWKIHLQAERMAGHPLAEDNPLIEAVRWSICEAELLQVIARGRGIRRTEANPLDVHILSDVALPVRIDQVTSREQAQPTPLEILAARGLVPDCQPEAKGYWPTVQAALSDLYPSPDAARFGFAATLSRDETSMNRYFIDESSRERWARLSARQPGSRYSIPVLVDPLRREELGAVLELAARKPENRKKQGARPTFATVAGFLVDHGIRATDPEVAARLVSAMLPTAFPTPQDAEEWLDAIPPEDRRFDVPEAALARDWQPEVVYFDQGDELLAVEVLVAGDARDRLARRLWLASPDPEIDAAVGAIVEALGPGTSMTCRFWDRAP